MVMYLYWLKEGKVKDLDYKIGMSEKYVIHIDFNYILEVNSFRIQRIYPIIFYRPW